MVGYINDNQSPFTCPIEIDNFFKIKIENSRIDLFSDQFQNQLKLKKKGRGRFRKTQKSQNHQKSPNLKSHDFPF